MEYQEIIAEITQRMMGRDGPLPTLSTEDKIRLANQATRRNDGPERLTIFDGYKCKICGDKGFIFLKDERGNPVTRECECMVRRRNLRRLKRSGLEDIAREYTFRKYQCEKPWQQNVKDLAMDFVKNGAGKWFFIAGNPGTGKTHICTAICTELISAGKEVRYFLWRSDANRLKAIANRPEYDGALREWKDAEVMYIDDFFKGRLTDADINLAFDLLNARYMARRKITILSSELTVEKILSIDEALGRRVYERSRGYCIAVPAEDWSLTHG